MQLAVPWRCGQSKPFGSIPRINRSHPLAQGLVFYGYDAGGPYLDLVGGSVATRDGTASSVTSGRYGSANVWPGTATYTDITWPKVNGTGAVKTLNPSFITTGIFSFGAGYCLTALPAAETALCVFADSIGSGFGTYLAHVAGADVLYATQDTQSGVNFSGLNSANAYHSVLSSCPTNSSQIFYFDGVQVGSGVITNLSTTTDDQPTLNTYQVNSGGGTDNGLAGQVYWFAAWNRALSATEARLLHDDPYCFLIYPEDEMFATLVGAAAVTANFGWWNRAIDERRLLPVSRLPDQSAAFFRPSPNPVPQRWLPITGENRERGIPITRRPDEPYPWFVRSPNSVPTTWMPRTGENRERDPGPMRRPDEPYPWFIRSPSPVPIFLWWGAWDQPKPSLPPDRYATTWYPPPPAAVNTIAGMAWWHAADDARLVAGRGVRSPDEATPYYARSPNPVPTTWMWPTGDNRNRDPAPVRRPDEPYPWFVQSPSPVPLFTVPETGNDLERPPSIKRSPDEPYPWFVRSPSPVPLFTVPETGNDLERPPSLKLNPDEAKRWFSAQAPVAISGMAWWQQAQAQPAPFPLDRYVITWIPPQPSAAVGISGIAWAISKEEKRPPLSPDQYIVTWLSQRPIAAANTIAGMAWWRPADDARLVVGRVKSSDEGIPWFRSSPVPVPARWLPTAGETERPLPAKADDRGAAFAPRIPPTGTIAGMAWWIPGEAYHNPPSVQDRPTTFVPQRQPQPGGGIGWLASQQRHDFARAFERDYSRLALRPPPAAASTIAGMAWWRPSDQPRPRPAFEITSASWLVSVTVSAGPLPNPDRTLANDHVRVRLLANDHYRVRILANDHVRVRTLAALN